MRERKFAIPADNIVRLVPHSGGCLATDRITVDGAEVGYMYREDTDRAEDTGWRFFSGDEDQAYINDLDNTTVYAVNTIANFDPDILPLLETEPPCAFEKIKGTSEYRRVTFP